MDIDSDNKTLLSQPFIRKNNISRIILDNILSKYSKITENDIKEYEIDLLLQKHNIEPSNYNKTDKKLINIFVNDLKLLINEKINSQPINNLSIQQNSSLLNTQPQSQPQPSFAYNPDISSINIINKDSLESINNKYYDTNIVNNNENTFMISIDSKDRNKEKFPNQNEFSINFGSNMNNVDINNLNDDFKQEEGFINKKLNKIKSIKLISIIIPYKTFDGDQIDNYPYLLLDIDELGGNYEGSNKSLSESFAKIFFDLKSNNWCSFTNNLNHNFIKNFNPVIDINKLTFRFKKPDGTLFNFGNTVIINNNIDIMCDISIILEIKT